MRCRQIKAPLLQYSSSSQTTRKCTECAGWLNVFQGNPWILTYLTNGCSVLRHSRSKWWNKKKNFIVQISQELFYTMKDLLHGLNEKLSWVHKAYPLLKLRLKLVSKTSLNLLIFQSFLSYTTLINLLKTFQMRRRWQKRRRIPSTNFRK